MGATKWLSRSAVATAILAGQLLAVGTTPASAAPGDLDPAFGNGGIVTLRWPGSFEADIGGVVQEPQTAKVVVTATILIGDPSSFTTRLGLARLTKKGTLDTGFGTGGYVDTDFGLQSTAAGSLKLLPDGKILAVGAVWKQKGTQIHTGIALARYLSNGTLDTTFGTGGKTYTFFPGKQDVAGRGVVLQDDGRIVVADHYGEFSGDFALARFQANGFVDTTFGEGGRLFTDLGGLDAAGGIARQPDGKLLVVGGSSSPAMPGFPSVIAMVRYKPDFSLDPTFGAGGKVLKSPGGRSYGVGGSATLQADGRIVLGGLSLTGPQDTAATVVRFLPDGKLDRSFGANGVVLYNPNPNDIDTFGPVALAPGNKLVTTLNSGQFSAGLARFNAADGSFDSTFGSGGVVAPVPRQSPQGMVVTPEGNIVVTKLRFAASGKLKADVDRYLGS